MKSKQSSCHHYLFLCEPTRCLFRAKYKRHRPSAQVQKPHDGPDCSRVFGDTVPAWRHEVGWGQVLGSGAHPQGRGDQRGGPDSPKQMSCVAQIGKGTEWELSAVIGCNGPFSESRWISFSSKVCRAMFLFWERGFWALESCPSAQKKHFVLFTNNCIVHILDQKSVCRTNMESPQLYL